MPPISPYTLIEKAESIGRYIGNTPIFDFSAWTGNPSVRLLAKAEWYQLGSSVKARAAFNIIKTAIASGELTQNQTIVDATSGNTGIALAAIGSQLGIKVHLFMPEDATVERKKTLEAFGAQITLTDPVEGTDGAQHHARSLIASKPESFFYADQYGNPNNWRAHYQTTAIEIMEQTEGKVTHFATALGTSGSFIGTGKRLGEIRPSIELVALQPNESTHGLEGWKHYATAQIIPKIYDSTVANRTVEVETEEAHRILIRAAKEFGVLMSPSSAGNLAGALKIAKELDSGTVVTLLPDSSERYGALIQQLF